MVERAVLISGDKLEKDVFSSQPGVEDTGTGIVAGRLVETEKSVIEKALEQSEGNMTQAARILGITRRTLYRRMEKYGLK